MKRAAIMFLVIALVAGGTWLLPAGAAEKAHRTKDEEAIQSLLAAGLKAFNDHDAKAWSLILHPDGEFTNVIGWSFQGPEEVETYHRLLFAKEQTPRLPSFAKVVMEYDGKPRIRFVRADTATVDQRWTITGEIGVDGTKSPKRFGMMILLVTNDKGVWRVASFHNLEYREVYGATRFTDIPRETPPEYLKRP